MCEFIIAFRLISKLVLLHFSSAISLSKKNWLQELSFTCFYYKWYITLFLNDTYLCDSLMEMNKRDYLLTSLAWCYTYSNTIKENEQVTFVTWLRRILQQLIHISVFFFAILSHLQKEKKPTVCMWCNYLFLVTPYRRKCEIIFR
jgi:hypothetical protein